MQMVPQNALYSYSENSRATLIAFCVIFALAAAVISVLAYTGVATKTFAMIAVSVAIVLIGILVISAIRGGVYETVVTMHEVILQSPKRTLVLKITDIREVEQGQSGSRVLSPKGTSQAFHYVMIKLKDGTKIVPENWGIGNQHAFMRAIQQAKQPSREQDKRAE